MAPKNSADFILISNGIKEYSPAGSLIGLLSAQEPDAGTTISYSLVAGDGSTDADNSLVEIVNNQVKVKSGATIDFQTNPVLNLNIQLTGKGKSQYSYTKGITASVIDVVPPTVSSVSFKGESVILKFSQAVTASSVANSTFAVATVDSKNKSTTRRVTQVALEPNDSTLIILSLAGTPISNDVNLSVSYTDPDSNQVIGVIQDQAGNDVSSFSSRFADTFIATSTTSLASKYRNLSLTGSGDINGMGNNLNNTINGNTGNNILDGGIGEDTMLGGAGNDTYVVDNAGDSITEAANAGTDTVQSSITYTLTANVENLTLTGSTAINGTGNNANNIITGNIGNNTLDGGEGADTMAGGAGDDTYHVDNADDVIIETENSGNDTVQSSITHALVANTENLTLTGSTIINGTGNNSNNILRGNGAKNVLDGGAGDDTLDGGAGADEMIGGAGNDTFVVDNTGDKVSEGLNSGTDTVQSFISYTLSFNVENLTLTGSSAINGTGNSMNNVLKGNSTANILTGGAGKDVLTGLGGSDTYKYNALSESSLSELDHITDFAIGTDILDGPTAVNALNTKELGAVATLDQAGISAVLTTAVFRSNQAATFTFGSGVSTRTFLALNDSTAGFSSARDGLIEITGYTGLLTDLAIL